MKQLIVPSAQRYYEAAKGLNIDVSRRENVVYGWGFKSYSKRFSKFIEVIK